MDSTVASLKEDVRLALGCGPGICSLDTDVLGTGILDESNAFCH